MAKMEITSETRSNVPVFASDLFFERFHFHEKAFGEYEDAVVFYYLAVLEGHTVLQL